MQCNESGRERTRSKTWMEVMRNYMESMGLVFIDAPGMNRRKIWVNWPTQVDLENSCKIVVG